MWLSESQLRDLRITRDAMLYGYTRMSSLQMPHGSLFPIKPKLHALVHIELHAQKTKMNPRSLWTFQEEDDMRIMMGICSKVHNNAMESSALKRWCMQFFAGIGDTVSQ